MNTIAIDIRVDNSKLLPAFINKFKCRDGEGSSCYLELQPLAQEGQHGETHSVRLTDKSRSTNGGVIGYGREIRRATEMPTNPAVLAEVRLDKIPDYAVKSFATKSGGEGLSVKLRVVPLLHPENNKFGSTHYVCIDNQDGEKVFCGNGVGIPSVAPATAPSAQVPVQPPTDEDPF